MGSRRQFLQRVGAAGATGFAAFAVPSLASARSVDDTTIALIGDYGTGSVGQQRVADLVSGWNPAGVFTLGDNVYSGDRADPAVALERKVLRYYRRFVDNGTFFPSLGNHDWGDPGVPLLWDDNAGGTTGPWHEAFRLPGNGRYYDVRMGPLHVFVLDDYYLEPDGHRIGSAQARWLQSSAGASDAPWKIVTHHYPAYTSPTGGQASIRWPFAEWGISAVFAGHWHHYERLHKDGVMYIVNGLGGAPFGFGGRRIAESAALFDSNHGAVRLTASERFLRTEFVDVDGIVRDDVRLTEVLNHDLDLVVAPPPVIEEPYLSMIGSDAALARLYVAAFERQPDPAGFAYWRERKLRTGRVADQFVASPEFSLRYGPLDDAGFLERVYRNVLGRPADRAGWDYWISVLSRGASRGTVLAGFSESAEFKNRTGIGG